MLAEIIATGSELLLGEQIDTNSAHVARKFREIGLSVTYKTVVGDDETRMIEAIRIALKRSDVILIGGGLGPTIDDVTRSAVARAVGRKLVFRDDLLEQIKARFKAFGTTMTENNRQQAYMPADAVPIENPVGTAPSFAVEHDDKVIICLPGVPRELKYLLKHKVLPYLQEKYNLTDVIVVRTLHTVGEGESRVDAAIADLQASTNPVIGLSAKPGQIDIRLAARGTSKDEALPLLADMESRILERLGKWIFGSDDETLEGVIAQLLTERKQSLATVEVNTGGTISGRLTSHNLAEEMNTAYRGGLVLSGTDALHRILDVDLEIDPLDMVASAAQQVREVNGSTLGLAVLLNISSVDGKVRSYFYTALASNSDTKTLERSYGGHSRLAAAWTASLALRMLWMYLKGEGD